MTSEVDFSAALSVATELMSGYLRRNPEITEVKERFVP